MRLITKLYIPFNILGMMVVILPLAWQWKARNTATVYMIIFSLMGCLVHLINGIIWADTLENYAPIWCDITSKLIMGLSVALPLASLCINRRLCKMAYSMTVHGSDSKRRDMIIDTIICIGGFLGFMALHYTMQGHRFDIYESWGCYPTIHLTPLGYAFMLFPPIGVQIVSSGFAIASFIRFFSRRKEHKELLSRGSEDSRTNYIRLMLLSSTELFFGFPCSIFVFANHLVRSVRTHSIPPYISWADTHANFQHINRFALAMIAAVGPAEIPSYEIGRFAFPINCFLFFFFFGMSIQAYQSYYGAYAWVMLKVFKKPVKSWDEFTKRRDPKKKRSCRLFGMVFVIYGAGETVKTAKEEDGNIAFRPSDLDVPRKPTKKRDSLGLSVISDDELEMGPIPHTPETDEKMTLAETPMSSSSKITLDKLSPAVYKSGIHGRRRFSDDRFSPSSQRTAIDVPEFCYDGTLYYDAKESEDVLPDSPTKGKGKAPEHPAELMPTIRPVSTPTAVVQLVFPETALVHCKGCQKDILVHLAPVLQSPTNAATHY